MVYLKPGLGVLFLSSFFTPFIKFLGWSGGIGFGPGPPSFPTYTTCQPISKAGCGMRSVEQGVKRLLFFFLFLAGAIPLVSAEPPARSIFQAKVAAAELKKPEGPRKEILLMQAMGLGEIQVPETYGRVIDVFQGGSDKTIIHIQDAHVHYEAQKNLASILESLIQRNQLKLILLEGGSGHVELASLRKLASREAREAVADRYLRKGLIAGDEYLELISDYPMIREGIEDPALYEENLRTFLEVDKFKKKALEEIEELRQVVEALKQKMYSGAHLDLEKKREAYDTEQIELVAYYEYLAALKAPSDYPNLTKLLEASRLEKEIDFEKVDDERDVLLKELSEKLTEEELGALTDKSLAYKEGAVSQKEYYSHLKHLVEEKGLAMSSSPNLDKYVSYLSLYNDIQHSELFREGDRLEEGVRESMIRSEDERQLASISKHLKLLLNLFQIKISPDDYATYQKEQLRFSVRTVLPFLEKKIEEYHLTLVLPDNAEEIDQHLKSLDHFYRVAQSRDLAFVENSLKEMDKEKTRVAVLITGGFHTPGLTQIFKEKGISYIVISPRITEAGNPELYYSVVKEKSGPDVQ